MLKKWKFLKEGDSVDIIAPGFLSTPEEAEGAIAFLKSWNLVPRLGSQVQGDHFLHSNSDEARFKDLKKALFTSESKVVWCLRGGYGANRLIPRLSKIKKAPTPVKLLIGISDVSSLHLYLNQKWNWPTLHAPLLDRLGQGKVSQPLQTQLKNILFGNTTEVQFESLKAMNPTALKIKKCQGPVVGGNLTVLQSSLGTPFEVNLKGKFLFIEDLAERGYRVDRILEHFKQAGVFKQCLGIFVGEFLGGHEPFSKASKVPQVLERFALENQIPMWSGLPVGHGENQWPLPFQTQACVSSSPNPTKNKILKPEFKLEIKTFGVK